MAKNDKMRKDRIQKKFKEEGGFEIDLDIKIKAIDDEFSEVPPADEMRVPLRQQVGSAGDPIVEEGQQVKYGQKLSEDEDDALTVPVHSPVNGTVKEVMRYENPLSGAPEPTVIIETKDEEREPYYDPMDPDKVSRDEMIERVRETGIVGQGGAVFPTHAKLKDAKDRVSHLIINAKESDPNVACDARLMIEEPEVMVDGIKLMAAMIGADNVIFATRTTEGEMPKLEKILKREGIEIARIRPNYSVGYGRLLVTEVLGKEVPDDKNPTDVGALVQNVLTAYAVSKAIRDGEPLIDRGLTYYSKDVGGKNLWVRQGTPVSKVFEFLGESPGKYERVILGSVMRGTWISDPSIPIIKAHQGIIAYKEEEPHPYEDQTWCIRCGYCNDVCPVDIYPNLIIEAQDIGDTDWLQKLNPGACIDCGLCAYVCPSHINFRPKMKKAKSETSKSKLKQI